VGPGKSALFQESAALKVKYMGSEHTHKWEFSARFRRGSFGWKSEPAITRIKQAVTEISKVARKDQIL
jgi:hypothetical protein